jgi:hypothetical protein
MSLPTQGNELSFMRIEIPTSGLHPAGQNACLRAFKGAQHWTTGVKRLYRGDGRRDSRYFEFSGDEFLRRREAIRATDSGRPSRKELVAAGNCPQFARHEVVRWPWPGDRDVAILEMPRRRAITILILGN